MAKTYLVDRQDWNEWLEKVEEICGSYQAYEPDWNSSKVQVYVTLPNTKVEVRFNFVALEWAGLEDYYYGRGDRWDCIRTDDYIGNAANRSGKGARSIEAKNEAQHLLNLLIEKGEEASDWSRWLNG